jgi:hypothetical protein
VKSTILPDFGQDRCDFGLVGSTIAGMVQSGPDDLVAHVVRTTQLDADVARRVVADVTAYFSETAEAFVRRRHRELQAAGLANPEIFDRIAGELTRRPVAAPPLSLRQIRRVVYG